jgi:hypothetical protein
MGAAVKRLTDMVGTTACYDTPWSELLPKQIEAANERLQERIGRIKVLANRAETANIKEIRKAADLVPLLFAHMTYKSYPEQWFTQGKWDKMSQWLDTLTTDRVRNIDVKGVNDIDVWIARLDAAGHYINCSSGTTGKCSMIPSNAADRAFIKHEITRAYSWSTGIPLKRDYKYIGLTPIPKSPRNDDGWGAFVEDFAISDHPFPGERISIGQISRMVALRRSIADGTARPGEITAFEATAAKREKAIEDGLTGVAELIVASRGEKMILGGHLPTAYKVAEIVRQMGYSAKDFRTDNAMLTGGGLKGAKLPEGFREYIFDTFNVTPQRAYQFYAMNELNTGMPRCKAGRYHVAPWLMVLVLDSAGEEMVPVVKGDVEGRAAFVDLSLDGRWCGVITGDKVRVNYGTCACGHKGPSVHDEIVRYSEMVGGDKISCSGTIDAYIRGAVQ